MTHRTLPDSTDFIAIYNDTKKYPLIADVAKKLKISRKTVINRSAIYRNDRLLIITRKREAALPVEPKPVDHAKARANRLKGEIDALLSRSKYPIINPESLMVDSYLSERYDRASGRYKDVEGTPRTWITDTLRVAPIEDCRNRKFLFTGAQNDAIVDQSFWVNLQAFAKFIDAEIVVGPWTYETQWWSENNPVSRSYDPLLTNHLCFGQLAIGDNFVFCGEMNTLPTASKPISDLTTYSRGRWAVFPHAKLALESVPTTDPKRQAHQVMTSGSVTRPKVIARKAGVKSIFHHVIGATLVEFDHEGDIFCRQINAEKDGSFYELDRYVANGVISVGHHVKSIVFADLHRAKLDPANTVAAFGVDIKRDVKVGYSMLDDLAPELIFIHDGHDQEIGNHHRAGDGHASFELAMRGRTCIKSEIASLGSFLSLLRRPGLRIIEVESNHDLALGRYIKEGRYRNDGVNLKFGLWLEGEMVEHREHVAKELDAYKAPKKFALLENALREIMGSLIDHVEWAYDGESFLVDDIECGHHGFRGANGAQGTVSGYAKMGRKMSIGDKHSPSINEGVYGAGAMNLQHGYNLGPSGWAVSHVLQYANGKRCIVTLQSGKWRA